MRWGVTPKNDDYLTLAPTCDEGRSQQGSSIAGRR